MNYVKYMNGLVFTLILLTFKSTWQLRRTPLATPLVTPSIVGFCPALLKFKLFIRITCIAADGRNVPSSSTLKANNVNTVMLSTT